MIYFTDCFAKVWEVKPHEKYLDMRISTSEKDRDGNYTNSNWTARCFGKTMELFAALPEKSRIKIKKGKVVNEKYTDKDGNKKSFVRVIIIDGEIADSVSNVAPAATVAPATNSTTDTEEEYPF